jgi:hypothetical protein
MNSLLYDQIEPFYSTQGQTQLVYKQARESFPLNVLSTSISKGLFLGREIEWEASPPLKMVSS